jgi:pilus assembly protein Flp/PilA
MAGFVFRFLKDVEGATAIEYAMIAVGVAVAIVATVNMLGVTVLTTKFQAVTDAMAP